MRTATIGPIYNINSGENLGFRGKLKFQIVVYFKIINRLSKKCISMLLKSSIVVFFSLNSISFKG